MTTIRTKLTVKELAAPLGVSVGFIYKMRMAGCPMRRERRKLVATVSQARAWLKASKFKVVDGTPSIYCTKHNKKVW